MPRRSGVCEQDLAEELVRAHPARVVREVRRALLGRQALEELEARARTVVRDAGLVVRDEAEHVVDAAVAVVRDRAGVVEHDRSRRAACDGCTCRS